MGNLFLNQNNLGAYVMLTLKFLGSSLFSSSCFFERKPWGKAPWQQENILKEEQVYKKAQPGVRQGEAKVEEEGEG